jgi:hypothetical protein
VDDDILYPPDYAARMIEALEAAGPDWLTCVHGTIFNPWLGTPGYYRRQLIYNFNLPLARTRQVMCAGTGTLCMRTDRFRITEKECLHPNMADIWTACKALREGKGIRCIKRPAGWLQPLPHGGTAITVSNPMPHVEAEVAAHQSAFRTLFGVIIGEEGGVPPQTEEDAIPLVSVVLPTRNRPSGLAQALESIAAQDYPAIQVIVVNDGGAPVTLSGCHDSGRRSFILIEQPTVHGPGATRNRALTRASGSYVTYLEDDALYLPPHLSGLVTLAQVNPNAAFWYTACHETLFKKTGTGFQPLRQTRKIGAPVNPGQDVSDSVALIGLLHRPPAPCAFPESIPCFEDRLFIAGLAALGPVEFYDRPDVLHTRRLGDTSQLSENPDLVAAARSAMARLRCSSFISPPQT